MRFIDRLVAPLAVLLALGALLPAPAFAQVRGGSGAGGIGGGDDPCNPNPCLNGGICTVDADVLPVCSCPLGWIGSQCDIPAETFDIDAFSTAQALLTAPASSTVTTTAVPPADILGKQRDIKVTKVGSDAVTAEVKNDTLVFTATGTARGDVEVVWDGEDGNPDRVSLSGPATDLKTNTWDSFAITASSVTSTATPAVPPVLILEVFTDGGHSSIRAFSLPILATAATYTLQYSGFVPNRGTGADFSAVRAIRMFLRGTGVTVTLDSIRVAIAAPTVTAQKAAPRGPVKPGDAIDYAVTVQGTSGDAKGAGFTDPVDANTTYVAGSLKASPIALNDAYPAPGVATVASPLSVSSALGVVANDRDPLSHPMTVTSTGTITTVRGNTVSMAGDGSFTWTDTHGLGGIPDTFAYTLGNDEGEPTLVDTGLVVITQTDDPPTITSTDPIANAKVGTDALIKLTFSEAVTATGASFTIDCGSGPRAFTLTGSGSQTLTLTPTGGLPAGASCTATALASGDIDDVDTIDPPGGLDADFTLKFTTDAAPTVTGTTPVNGAVNQAANTDITITFSEPVSVTPTAFTLECPSGTTFAGGFVNTTGAGPATTFTLNPNGDLPYGTLCTVKVVANQVTDKDGLAPDHMAADYTFSFGVDAQPSVSSTVPADGSLSAAPDTNITINFSEPVDVSPTTFAIVCPAVGGTAQAFAFVGGTTNVASVVLHPGSNLPDGVLCKVTVNKDEVHDSDLADPPDGLAADYVFTFGVRPRVGDDDRNATGNVRIQTSGSGRSGFSVLINDQAGVTITGFDAKSTLGGDVAVAADGTFTYDPPAGLTGTDSFHYTISNAAGSNVGTVTITISDVIWFVNNAAGACSVGCGRLTHPFTSLAAFVSKAGDHVFIYSGSGSYTGPLNLKDNQRAIGQGATGTLASLAGITPATDSDALPATGGTKPVIGSTVAGINLALNNQVYGLQLTNTAQAAITNAAGSVGTLTLADIGVSNTTGTSGGGIILTGGGTVTATGTNTLNAVSGIALNVTNTTIGAGGLTFRSISCGNGDGNPDPASGIILNNTGSTAGLTVTGTGSAGTGGSIQNMTGSGIVLTSTKSPSLSWMAVADSAGAVTDDGIAMTNVSGDVTLDHVQVSNAPHNGIRVDNFNTNMSSFALTNSTVQCAVGNVCQIGNDGLLLSMRGTSVLNSGSVTGSTFTGLRVVGVQIQTEDTARIGSSAGGAIATPVASNSFTIQTSTFSGNGQAVDVDAMKVSSLAFRVLGNTITGTRATAINAFTTAGDDQTPTLAHAFVGVIQSNVIGVAGTKDSGSVFGNGIRNMVQGYQTQGALTVSNNQIRELVNAEMVTVTGQNGAADTGSGAARFKITSNDMGAAPSGTTQDLCALVSANKACAASGIFVLADEHNPVCAAITGNTVYDVQSMNSGTAIYDVYLAERVGPPTGAALTVEGTGGSNATYIPDPANNTLAGTNKYFDEGSLSAQVGSCGVFP